MKPLEKLWFALGTIVIVGVSGLLFAFAADERNRKTLFEPQGKVQGNREFGVGLGDARANAMKALANNGFKHVFSEPDGECGGVKGEIDSFRDYGWRHGGICLASANGVVVAMAWDFRPFGP